MDNSILYCLLLAHLISDFVLQSSKIVGMRYNENKRERLRGNSIHALIYFVVSLVCLAYFLSRKVFILILVISIIHFLIDAIKSWYISKRPFIQHSIIFFSLDQLIHFASIILLIYLANSQMHLPSSYVTLASFFKNLFQIPISQDTVLQRVLLSLVLLVAALWGVGVFIRTFFNYVQFRCYKSAINHKIVIKTSDDEENGARDGGFIIGILERLFIISVIVLNMTTIIGFVLATKSIARFKKFDDDRFVEIFIIGSFISFISAIIFGIAIKELGIISI